MQHYIAIATLILFGSFAHAIDLNCQLTSNSPAKLNITQTQTLTTDSNGIQAAKIEIKASADGHDLDVMAAAMSGLNMLTIDITDNATGLSSNASSHSSDLASLYVQSTLKTPDKNAYQVLCLMH